MVDRRLSFGLSGTVVDVVVIIAAIHAEVVVLSMLLLGFGEGSTRE